MMRSLARFYLALCLLGLALAGATPVRGQTVNFGTPQLYVSKIADRPTVAPGEIVTYTLTYGNTGNGIATAIAISDVLPQGTTFVDATGGGVLFGSTVYWGLGALNPGQSGSVTLRLRVNPGFPNGATIANSAQISSVEAPVGVPGNTAAVTVGATPLPSALQVTKQVDAAVATPGQPLNYTLRVTNNGSGPAANVTLMDPIPAGTTAVSASDGGLLAGNGATWSLGTIPAQGSRQVTLRVQVNPNAGGTITNTAQASSLTAPAPVSSNNVSVLVSAAPSLSLTKTVDRESAQPGDILTYTLSFTNSGPTPLSNGSLFDGIPAGTQFVDASSGGTFSGDTVVWTFASLAPGSGGVASFRVRVAADALPGQQIRNQAQLAIVAQGSVVNSQPVVTTVAAPGAALTLAKFVDRTAARVGDILTYTLNYSNLSSATATGAEILDPLPAGLSFIDAQGNVQIDIPTRTLRFNLGTIAPHGLGTVSFRARVEATAPAGGSLTNQARLTAAGLTLPVTSNAATTLIGTGVGSFAGTYRLIQSSTPASITVDPRNHFTVIAVTSSGFSQVGLGAQGTLNADGSFDVVDPSGRARFTGRINPGSQAASIQIQWIGGRSYSVLLPRAPVFNPLPDILVGTFVGSVTNPRGDRLRVLMSIDPEGNSTFQADLIQLFPTLVRHKSGSYQVTPTGLVGAGGQTDGFLQPAGNSLVLVYNYRTSGYQATFQIPLARR